MSKTTLRHTRLYKRGKGKHPDERMPPVPAQVQVKASAERASPSQGQILPLQQSILDRVAGPSGDHVLSDSRIQQVQRQAIAAQIMGVSGNHYLQRVLIQLQKKGKIPKEAIPSSKLGKWGTAEQMKFMREVYDAQLQKSAADKKKEFFPGYEAEDLQDVENGQQMHKDAAGDCKDLLDQAREDLKTEQEAVKAKQLTGEALTKAEKRVLKVSDITIRSGYRSMKQDFSAWQNAFKTQYEQSEDQRGELDDGEHGPEAVKLMVRRMYGAKAIPGYSNHTKGLAADFTTKEGRWRFGPSTAQKAGWRKTWFYHWLVKNADSYGFKPYYKEPWHWDYKE